MSNFGRFRFSPKANDPMFKRFFITLGATTTAGGAVKTASSKSFIAGVPKAVEGDRIDCPACGSEGVIQVVQPRLRDCYAGKEFALSDDLCVCNCNPAPKLVANQQSVCQTFAAFDQSTELGAAHAVNGGTDELLPMRFIDYETKKPHAHRPYRLDLKNKRVIAGTTDANGCTRPLTKEERDAVTAWNISEEQA